MNNLELATIIKNNIGLKNLEEGGEQLRELTQDEALAANKTYKIVYPSVIYFDSTNKIYTVKATSSIYYKFLADVTNYNEFMVTATMLDEDITTTLSIWLLIIITPIEKKLWDDTHSAFMDATELHIYEVI